VSQSRREQQVAIAQRLRTEGEGLSIPAIAREMGISVAYAGELLTRPRTKWTKEMVIEAIQEWHLLYGNIPAIEDWKLRRNLPGWCPTYKVVYRLFGPGGWNKAMEAAGFTPRPAHAPEWTHGYVEPRPMSPEVREQMSEDRRELYAANPEHPMFRGLRIGHQIAREHQSSRQKRSS
jgi:hypothetical protein